jgi:uncharacterized Rossmann fold enzyme
MLNKMDINNERKDNIKNKKLKMAKDLIMIFRGIYNKVRAILEL